MKKPKTFVSRLLETIQFMLVFIGMIGAYYFWDIIGLVFYLVFVFGMVEIFGEQFD